MVHFSRIYKNCRELDYVQLYSSQEFVYVHFPVHEFSSCLQTRQAFTAEQINEACYVDVKSNKAVFDSLSNNLKVYYDGRRFSYKVYYKDKFWCWALVLFLSSTFGFISSSSFCLEKRNTYILEKAGFTSSSSFSFKKEKQIYIRKSCRGFFLVSMYLCANYMICLCLQSKHDLKDKSQLLKLVRKFPEGIAVIDLKDAYPSVMDDLQVNSYLVGMQFDLM